ncbi:MAG TPA: SusC/RagA family TonB-linked outer membrane protein, partial [Cyclobacteriaceae bacterium]|nr:SusC/RagA family TonB-linked outer membrane protein [Cyclobacteriaceae bacterium]
NVAVGLDMGPRVRFESNLNYNRQYTDNIPDVNYGPNSMIYNVIIWGGADWDIDDMKRQMYQPGKEGLQQMYADYTRYNNPWFMTTQWLRGHHKTDTYGYMSLKYDIAKGLNLVARTQINTYDILRTEKFPYSATVYGREQAKGDYREDSRKLFENNTDVLLTYSKDFTPDFHFKGSLGGNLRSFKYNSSYVTTDYLNVPNLYNFTNSLNPIRAFNFNSDMQVASAYGYLDFDYQNFLSLSVTGRSDKSSALPVKQNSYFYPSASLSAVISEKVDLPKFWTFLKARGSYAKVGSTLTQSTIESAWKYVGARSNPLEYGSSYETPYEGPSYGNTAAYETGRGFNNVIMASYSNNIANANLLPAFSETWETGLDFKFLDNRLGLDVTYFQALDGPFIFKKPISQTSGYESFQDNGIKTLRKGWEVTLMGTPVKRENFSWNVLANYSTYKETLKEVAPGLDRIEAIYFNGSSEGNNSFINVGERIDRYFGYAFLKTPDGQIINDDSGRPMVSPVPQFLGNLNPDFVWGLTNKFNYKSFTLTVQFDGRVGGKIVDYVQRQTYRGGRIINTVEGAMGEARYQDYLGVKSWTGEGVRPSGVVNVDDKGNITNYNELTYTPNDVKTYLQDWISRYYAQEEANLISRSYAKLREVTLTYQVPSSVLGNSFIRQASVSLISRNLLYFAQRKDIDIDQYGNNLQGYSSLQTPTTRRYGINLNFIF